MGKVLVIVESPTKAKTIRRFLGKNFTVRSSMGHIRDLPKSQLGVDLGNDFSPKYITIRGKGEILKELRSEVKKSSTVLLGPDPDREGEAIAWHLQQALSLEEAPCRIEFHEVTKSAIKNAIEKPRAIDSCLVDAQQARRVLDRLVGYNLSPLLWKKVRKGLSAGRVQSVAVKLIVDREREIEAFEPEEYWSLTALIEKDKIKFEAKLLHKGKKKISIANEEEMSAVLREIEGQPFVVGTVKKRKRKRRPYPPFITSTLQQEAYRRLNFTARKTMRIAQQLYEGINLGGKQGAVGLITYIRTDSPRIAAGAAQECREYIQANFGKEYLPETPPKYGSSKTSQGAHEAIRPTSISREPQSIKTSLSRDQFRLYRLIWDRYVASQMQAAVLDMTTIDIWAGDYMFRANGSVVAFPGFLAVQMRSSAKENADEMSETLVPLLEKGEELNVLELKPKQHFTQPPPRYTEASLVKTLEESGIGRPSTYAPIIETIVSRGYVAREEKQFFPTELGTVVNDLLEEYFEDIINVQFTANLEDKLDQVETGEIDWKEVVRDFYKPFEGVLKTAEQEVGEVEIEDEVTDVVCEECGRNMVVKYGRYGKFLACPGFPDCRNTKPFLEEIGVNCPVCGEGKVVVRRSRKGRKFFGCSNFPDCQFISWDRPSGTVCPECGSPLVEKHSRVKQKRLVCSNKDCSHEEKAVGRGKRAEANSMD